MKLQCSCGAKYEFEPTPEMAHGPVQFICPACGLDSSAFVNQLVRQELGLPPITPQTPASTAAVAAPGLSQHPTTARSTVTLRSHSAEPVHPETAPASTGGLPRCSKHPHEIANQKCYVCSKPICPKCMELFGYVCSPLCRAKAASHGIEVPVYAGQRSVIEARRWRRAGQLGWAVALLMLTALGLWFWFTFWGSKPRTIFSVRFELPAYSGQSRLCGDDQIVFLHGGTLARYSLHPQKQVWSRSLLDQKLISEGAERELKAAKAAIDHANLTAPDNTLKMPDPVKLAESVERAQAAALELRVNGHNIWVVSPGKLVQYDWETGTPAKEIPLNERASQPTGTRGFPSAGFPAGMPGQDAGKPMDPTKVAEQMQHLPLPARIALPAMLSAHYNQERALNEINDKSGNSPQPVTGGGASDNLPLLVPTKDGFVEFSARMLEKRIVFHSAMKASSGKSALEGAVTASKSTEIANEILNDMQRSRGGDMVEEDLSRYEVTLQQPDGKNPWTGEVVGRPKLYPLQTISVLAAGKTIAVFDRANRKLWESTLNYGLVGELSEPDEPSSSYGAGPCVEHKDSLYVFDQGVLTAFDLATGKVRWRLPSVGVAGLFFDDKDLMYVNTTSASPEKIKYSRQIDISQKATSIVLKINPMTGKVLWTSQSIGLLTYVSGKYLYAVQSYQPEEEESPYVPETGFEARPYLRLKRVNPRNGRPLWEHYQERAPLDIHFDENRIELVFKKEVQVLKFLSL